ncbi:serine hydrolase [Streptomyces sp. NPDC057011]|uniref:serine hydrolase n=1 Tax=unclassified Streptomyces TaxID=2593676 RepID=UPI00362FBFEB
MEADGAESVEAGAEGAEQGAPSTTVPAGASAADGQANPDGTGPSPTAAEPVATAEAEGPDGAQPTDADDSETPVRTANSPLKPVATAENETASGATHSEPADTATAPEPQDDDSETPVRTANSPLKPGDTAENETASGATHSEAADTATAPDPRDADAATPATAEPTDTADGAAPAATEPTDTTDAATPAAAEPTDAADAATPAAAEATGGAPEEPAEAEQVADSARPETAEAGEAAEAGEGEAAEAGGGEAAAGSASSAGGAGETAAGGREVPSWAREVESDSERTSKFVALKDLDASRPSGPQAPAAPAAPEAPEAGASAPHGTPGTGGGTAGGAAAAVGAPMELLAELTNTAPPPETPRRTVVRRVKVWTPILLLLAGGVAGAQLLRPLPAPRFVAAETVHTLPGEFGVPWPAKGQGAVRIPGSGDIGTFGEQKPVPTASVAKVMTAYVVLKGHPLRKAEPGPDITVDAKAVADGTAEHESRIKGLTAGTKFSEQDMLKMLMIPSGNNVARLLARWDTGSDNETAFVEKMNAAARDLGMKDTTYTDPSGLDAGTVSTAADQLKLAEAVMKDEAFRTVVALPNATIKGVPEPIYNNNDLLTGNGLSIRGIKTGSSTPAGGTLMWAAYKTVGDKTVGDQTPLILGTLMDQHVDGPDPDGANSLVLVKANSKKIIEAVREALAAAPVVRKGQTVGYVDDGLGGRTPLVATKDLNTVGVPGQQLRISLATAVGGKGVPHSAKSGAEVGVLTVGDGDGARSVPVAVLGDLAEPSLKARLTRLG